MFSKHQSILNAKLTTLVLGLMALTLTPLAQGAGTGGQTLVNAVTVDYQNAAGVDMTQVTAQVTVNITQVYGFAWQNYGTNQVQDTGATVGAGAAMTVELISTGNATQVIDPVSTADTTSGANLSNISLTYECDDGGAFSTDCHTGTFELAAFGIDEVTGVTGAGTGTAAVVVTADFVDELAAGDRVQIGTNVYDVVSVNNGTETITLDDTGATLVADIAGGDAILREVISFRIYNDVGDINVDPNPATQDTHEDHVFEFTADETGANATATTTPANNEFQIAVVGPRIAMTKFVRNNTDNAAPTGAGCAGNEITLNGLTYGDTSQATCDLEAVGDDVLEYVIQIANADGLTNTACGTLEANAGNCAGPASATQMVDDYPDYTTVVTTGGGAPRVDVSCDNSVQITVGVDENIGDDEGPGVGEIEFDDVTPGDNIFYYVNGDDGDTDGVGTGTGGTLGVDGSVCFVYQVTVD